MNTVRLLVVFVLVSACASPSTPPAASAPDEAKLSRRAFEPTFEGRPVIKGISYGPFREGQSPAGPFPTREQILEDLKILAPEWHMIRIYGSGDPAEDVLSVIREHSLPIKVMLGVWIAPDEDNERGVRNVIDLANRYQDVVFAVNVGNECQVFWSAHRFPMDRLIEYIREVRAAIEQPVTTADDYNFWNKPESHAVAKEVDFLLLHAYAMWNGKALEEAVSWTAETVDAIQREHPDLEIVIGETGWATELNPEGSENEHIKAPAGIEEQQRFFREFTTWAGGTGVPYFYFEAFDEPWKGSSDPREVEKHWGLYNVDRTPKSP
ncbi:MAG: glycosyl hydrolase family 17 protein [Myxococcota bacterium]